MTSKVEELVGSMANELTANWAKEWTFDGESIADWDCSVNSIILKLEDGTHLEISVKELPGDQRQCPRCNTMKGGWPNGWRNTAEGKGTKYACADCAQIHKDTQEETSVSSGG